MAVLHRRTRPPAGAFWLACAITVPSLVSLVAAGWGLPEVVATGMCPPAPPDIPAYPCSAQEYLLRMTLGPWALAGHIFVWSAWMSLVGATWAVVHFLRGRKRAPNPAP